MDEQNGSENGSEGRRARVKFGNGPGMSVPHEWAEVILRYLWAHEPEAARAGLCHAMGLPIPEKGSRRRTGVHVE